MMIHTWEFDEWISLYALGILSGEGLKAVESHISGGCEVCRETLSETEYSLALIPFSLADAPMPGRLLDKIFSRINAAEGNIKKNLLFEEAFDRHAGALYEFALKITRSESRAEEIVEAAFGDLAPEFSDDGDLFSRLTAAAIKIMNPDAGRMLKLPKFKRDRHHKTSPVADWSRAAVDADLSRRIGDALECLSATERVALALKDGEGMSDAEITRALGIERRVLKRALHTARLRIRGSLSASIENFF